jgi:hypothetical protein
MSRGRWLVLAGAPILVICACHSQQDPPKTEVSSSRAQPMHCTPILVPSSIVSKYPPNEKPGLDTPEQVTALLEKRWPLENVRKFAILERRHNDAYQNLVPSGHQTWSGRLYCDQSTGFDSIEWYATIEKSRGKDSLKEFSLGAIRGKDFWLLEMGNPDSVQKPPTIEPDFRAPYFVGHR